MNLKKIRIEKGLTIPRLAERSGIPYRTVENIQRAGDCKVSQAIKLAAALGVTLDELCVADDMNTSELLAKMTEENQTRKILEIIRECQTIEEAVEKIQAIIKNS
ncbi:MAG: helix-turn-helix domain-containing protein [Ruminococcus sp.]|nr:helix-turn-helix domain-containing protein [Ruminococcus sp.]